MGDQETSGPLSGKDGYGMKKIGFIDYFLDEWHANHLPQWIQDAGKGEYQVCYAWGEMDKEGRRSNAQWAAEMKIQLLDSIEEVVERSDYLVVLSPDNPERHEALCQIPLSSGKPCYVDKTFAPDAASARRMVELARKHHTPMFSSSALRFSTELKDLCLDGVRFASSRGPGSAVNYLIHHIEMLVLLMDAPATRLMSLGNENCYSYLLEFPPAKGENCAEKRYAAFQLLGGASPFTLAIGYDGRKPVVIPECTNYFENFVVELLRFFDTGAAPVNPDDTVNIMGIISAAVRGMNCPGQWLSVE